MGAISRRGILRLGGWCATAAWTNRIALGSANTAAATTLTPASYGDVELREGPMLDQFRTQHATLMAMNEDSLLKPYRIAAGQEAPGADLGGWYNASATFNPPADMHGFIPGHCFGQYLSSLARVYAVTGDEQTRQKVQRLVAGFRPTITPHFYDGYTLPAYAFDKINIGLSDSHAFAADPAALDALNQALDAALPHLPEKALTRPQMQARPHANVAFTWDESYTLPENLYLAWRRGAGSRYRSLASRFLLDAEYFDPLARGENVLPGKHAYSHVNALSSAMQAYWVDGDPKHLQAARNGFAFVSAQSFATGGWGPNEGFVVSGSGALGDSLNTTHASFEAPCGSYGHFKISRYLLSTIGDSRYGDSMERVLYNAALGVLPMKPDGTAFYYADYNASGSKQYFEYRCPCCSGTLGQLTADYGISTYLLSERGVFVNLYTPSVLRWRQKGRQMSLEQSTAYPLDSLIQFTIRTPTPETFSVSLRIPEWAGDGVTVAINGKRIGEPVIAGAFHEIRRNWTDGDRIELVLDTSVRVAAVDDKHPNLLALMQGPLALFAVGDRFLPLTRGELLSARQSAPGSPEWSLRTADGTQLFKPYFSIGKESTRLYQPVSS